MDIDKAIRLFSEFLNKSWADVIPLLSDRSYTSDDSSKSDWLQSNWELLVERKVLQLNEYLEIYGEGADFYGASSRITEIDSAPTHSVTVLVNNERDELNNVEIVNSAFRFERLIGFTDGYYNDCPPFDFVLVNDDELDVERVFLLSRVKFQLQPAV